MDRRNFLILAASGAGALALAKLPRPAAAAVAERIEKLRRSDAEWKRLLTPQQYDILRQEGTEAPFSSPLNHEKRGGLFACVACDLPLFPSRFKYDSGNNVITVRMFGHCTFNFIVGLIFIGRNVNKRFRATIAVLFFIIHYAVPQRLVGSILLSFGDSRINVKS